MAYQIKTRTKKFKEVSSKVENYEVCIKGSFKVFFKSIKNMQNNLQTFVKLKNDGEHKYFLTFLMNILTMLKYNSLETKNVFMMTYIEILFK